MKVCNYLETSRFVGGVKTAHRHQKKVLRKQGVEVSTSFKEDFDLLHVNSFGIKSHVAINRARRMEKPVIIHAHTTEKDIKNSFKGANLFSPVFGKFLRYYYNRADLVLTPSKYTKRSLKGYPVTRPIKVITNGVDLEKFSYRKRRGEVERIVTVGIALERKGLKTFIDLARRFPGKEFVWFGKIFNSFFLKGEVTKLIKNSPKNVTFTGYVEDIPGAYDSGDLFLFPSWSENQGIALLEAAASGLPLVVRNLATYQGWLKDGENCLKCGGLEDFEDSLRRLIRSDGFRKDLSENSRKLAKANSLDFMGEKLLNIYEEICKEGEGGHLNSYK